MLVPAIEWKQKGDLQQCQLFQSSVRLLPPDLYLFTGLRSLSSALQPEGSPSPQAGLWYRARSALASLESSQFLSQF